jgi:hypothetical protein
VIKVLRESEEIEDKVTVKEVADQGLKEWIEVEIWLHIKVEV